MLSKKNRLFLIILIFALIATTPKNVNAIEGCLIGNTFYTSYLGYLRTTDGSFSGRKKVFQINGNMADINYSGTNSCGKVTAQGGNIPRNGDLCFVMSQMQYNSYPVTQGQSATRTSPNYPGGNGTLQNFNIYNGVECPLDDNILYVLAGSLGLGFFIIRKNVKI